jgi:hypothetical protein
MATANKERGEVSVKLKGTAPLVLRPTFDAICKIEAATGQSVTRLAQSLMSGESLGIGVAATILFEGSRPTGSTLEKKKIGEAIVRTGLGEVTPAIVEFITVFLVGDTATGEDEAPTDDNEE